jgi:hypothetical protein
VACLLAQPIFGGFGAAGAVDLSSQLSIGRVNIEAALVLGDGVLVFSTIEEQIAQLDGCADLLGIWRRFGRWRLLD